MSLKRIINKPIPENEKREKRILNTNQLTHERVSLLADVFNVSKGQVINNIVLEFVREYEKEIKEYIALKNKQLDSIL